MKVCNVSQNRYFPNFTGIKYRDGIKTKNALCDEMKEFLSANEERINSLRDVDLLVDSEKDNFMLALKNIRYLNPLYKRFYENGKYNIQLKDDGNIEIWNHKSVDIHYRRSLIPTNVPGIYEISIARILGFLDLSPEYDSYNSMENTLQCAELIDATSRQIDEAESVYGMNCVEVLDNVDKDLEFGHRMNIIDEIINIYTFEDNNQEKMPTRNLEALYLHRETVKRFQSYGIHLADEYATPEIYDKKGYINEVYSEFYEHNGYVIKYNADRNYYLIAPIEDDCVYYTLYPQKANKYRCHWDDYEGGSNLSSFAGNHFDELVDFAKILEKVALSIEEDQRSQL